MSKCEAKIIADSISPAGHRLTTFVLKYWRGIHSEVLTHRMLSKNSSSSRAETVKHKVERVKNEMFIPDRFAKNCKGMSNKEWLENIIKGEWRTTVYDELNNPTEVVLTDQEAAENIWKDAAKESIRAAYRLGKENLNVHKQHANRLTEPFEYITVIVTGTQWEGFWEQRCPKYHTPVSGEGFYFRSKKDCIANHSNPENLDKLNSFTPEQWHEINANTAQPEMMELAEMMWDAMQESKPKLLKGGEWHIPFGDNIDGEKAYKARQDYFAEKSAKLNAHVPKGESLDYGRLEFLDHDGQVQEAKMMIAIARCARTSYLNHEGKDDYDADIKLYNFLVEQKHCYTEGTEVLTDKGWKLFENVNKDDLIADISLKCEFNGFKSPLSIIKKEYDGLIYNYKQKDLDLQVTDNHTLIGIPINRFTDRCKDVNSVEAFAANTSRSEIKGGKIKYQTKGEQELIMFSAVSSNNIIGTEHDFLMGKLVGFFIGDGFCKTKSRACFRLKKERKIIYLKSLLDSLNIQYKIKIDKYNVTNISFNFDLTNCYDEQRNKVIPYKYGMLNNELLKGIFDGLLNSDGSIKRKTWCYYTNSFRLKEQIKDLSCLTGLTVNEIKSKQYKGDGKTNYRLMFQTSNKLLVNDTRKKHERVSIDSYKGNVYCFTMESGALLIRRNGKVVISGNCSPLEHVCRAMTDEEYESHIKGVINIAPSSNGTIIEIPDEAKGWCANMRGFITHRFEIE